MRALVITAGAAAMLMLGGCETDPDLGYSVRRAVVAQAVDMTPTYAGVPIEGTNGVRSSDAQRRYLKGDPAKLGNIGAGVVQAGVTNSSGAGRPAPSE